VANHTWTGVWGPVTYWNAYVANLEMHGQGNVFDPRFDNATKYPVAARTGQGHVTHDPDLITSKLPALDVYQMVLTTPAPPPEAFDQAMAVRGRALFFGQAKCGTCHVAPTYSEPGWNLHTGSEIGIDEFQAQRAPDDRYRTSPLRALWSTDKVHKNGFYHDGRDVVNHYNDTFSLGLSSPQTSDLIEFLKSL
jgi:hypothetical protein